LLVVVHSYVSDERTHRRQKHWKLLQKLLHVIFELKF